MTPLLWIAAAVAVATAVVESQRRTNAQASARAWHRDSEHKDRVIARLDDRIARLEIALGRRKPGHWVPRPITPPPERPAAPTEAEVHLWLIATDGTPAPYQRYPFAEYQPTDDRVRHRQPRARALRRAS